MPTDADLRALLERWRKIYMHPAAERPFSNGVRGCCDELESLLRPQEPEPASLLLAAREAVAALKRFTSIKGESYVLLRTEAFYRLRDVVEGRPPEPEQAARERPEHDCDDEDCQRCFHLAPLAAERGRT